MDSPTPIKPLHKITVWLVGLVGALDIIGYIYTGRTVAGILFIPVVYIVVRLLRLPYKPKAGPDPDAQERVKLIGLGLLFLIIHFIITRFW